MTGLVSLLVLVTLVEARRKKIKNKTYSCLLYTVHLKGGIFQLSKNSDNQKKK